MIEIWYIFSLSVNPLDAEDNILSDQRKTPSHKRFRNCYSRYLLFSIGLANNVTNNKKNYIQKAGIWNTIIYSCATANLGGTVLHSKLTRANFRLNVCDDCLMGSLLNQSTKSLAEIQYNVSHFNVWCLIKFYNTERN